MNLSTHAGQSRELASPVFKCPYCNSGIKTDRYLENGVTADFYSSTDKLPRQHPAVIYEFECGFGAYWYCLCPNCGCDMAQGTYKAGGPVIDNISMETCIPIFKCVKCGHSIRAR